MRDYDDILARALAGSGASRDAARLLLSDAISVDMLMDGAEEIRRKFFGDRARFCAIVNARSGACAADCRFCAQSAHAHTDAPQYPLLDPEAIFAKAKEAANAGANCFGIVTSGPAASDAEVESIAAAIRHIHQTLPLEVSVSLGMLSDANFRVLRDAGLARFHHNLETSRSFFPNICTTHTWDERCATLKRARAAGLGLCSGGLFGLGETWEDRIDLGLALRELDVKSVPLNFLNPVPGTEMGTRPPLEPDEALRLIALFRFLLPDATLRVCGGRPVALRERQGELFRAGANGLMTGNYLTTPGYTPADDRRLLEQAGLRLADNPCA